MFRNVGKQIKGITIFLAVIEILAALGFAGFTVYMGLEENQDILQVALIAAGFVVGGILVAWLSNLFLYSYGQLVDNTDRIAKSMEALVKKSRHNSDY